MSRAHYLTKREGLRTCDNTLAEAQQRIRKVIWYFDKVQFEELRRLIVLIGESRQTIQEQLTETQGHLSEEN